jgi:translation initiation factor 5B
LLIVGPDDDVEQLKEQVQQDLTQALTTLQLDKDGRGVYVQASTLGSLEALLEFLKTSKIPVAGINIGPIHKKDVMKAAVMLERDPAYAVILGFNVEPSRDAREHATALGVQIFTAEIIYHLEDAFVAYLDRVKAQRQALAANDIVWPCILEVCVCVCVGSFALCR